MTGLEKILQEIAGDAQKAADETMQKAKAKAADEVARIEAESKAQVENIQREGEAHVADIQRAGESAVGLQRRQRMLEVKQEIIEDTLQKALAAMKALPDAEYFALLLKLAANAAEPGEGAMLLDDADMARVPGGFEASLANALPAGAKLAVEKAQGPIGGGFILKYGDIEQNCSFAAIVDERREEFSDAVRDILFV